MSPRRTAPLHPAVAKLRELRKAAGLSLDQLERKHGLKAVAVGSYERGDRHPSVTTLQRVLDVYGYQLVAVPRHHRVDGGPVIRTPEGITAVLRQIADQLDPDKPPLPTTEEAER